MQYYNKSMFLVKALIFMVVSLAIYMTFLNDKVLSLMDKQKHQYELQQTLLEEIRTRNESAEQKPENNINNGNYEYNYPVQDERYIQKESENKQNHENYPNRAQDDINNQLQIQQNQYQIQHQPFVQSDSQIVNQQQDIKKIPQQQDVEQIIPEPPIEQPIMPEENSKQMIPVQ